MRWAHLIARTFGHGHRVIVGNLRQSLPAAGILEEYESARGERGKVGQGRVGFRVQARARWEGPFMATCLLKKWFSITKMFFAFRNLI